MTRGTARRLWVTAHRWMGLSLGLLLLVIALTGTALTVARPLDRWANPELLHVPDRPSSPSLLEDARQALLREFGKEMRLTLRPPRRAGDSLWAHVRGPWKGIVYFDPASGRELGRRAEDEGFFNLLFEFHSELLLGATGKAVLASGALAYLLLLVSGLVLWWPGRWRHAWTVKLRSGTTRALFDLHRVSGAVLGLLIAVPVASGAYMAWKPISAAVTALSGASAVAPPKLPANAPAVGAAPVTLDAMVRQALEAFPGGMVGYVQSSSRPESPVRVRVKLPDDPHPNGLSSVWLHPLTGEVVGKHRWNELDAGARAYSVIYPLHTGELGGTVYTVVTAVLGLALAGLGVSGLWLWWRRA